MVVQEDTTMAWEKWHGGRCWVSKGTRVYHIYKMRNGRRYSVSTRCSNPKAAAREFERWELDPDNYQALGTDEVLITDKLVEGFKLAGEAAGNSEGRVWKREHYMKWWKERLDGFDLRKLKPQDVYAKVKGEDNPETKKSILKTFVRWMVREGLLERAIDIQVQPAVPAQHTSPKLFSRERHSKMVKALDPKYGDLLLILAGTGWHISELQRFAESGKIEYPEHQTDPMDSRYVLITPRHKSGDIHKTEVSAKVEEAAVRVLERGAFNRVLLHRAMNKAAAKSEGKDKFVSYPPSWYRHTVATWAIEKGADPAAVSVFLGHRHPATVKKFYITHAVIPKVPTLE
jgi:integrase